MPYAVVDLFAGPGGLGEGFAQCREPDGKSRFATVLSVENDHHAHRTLLLRSFLRKFEDDPPDEYYRFLNGESPEPNWKELDTDKWRKAVNETRCLELGTAEAHDFLEERIEEIRGKWGDRTILLGGPPCQAYSVVGRVRNKGEPTYDIRKDSRYKLYEEYIEVLARLQPAVAVMENVKGLLSANLKGERIFPVVLAGLRYPRNRTTYRTYALCPRSRNENLLDHAADPADFVVRAEEHGVPQRRHRVFVVCVRHDIADALPVTVLPRLKPWADRVTVDEVIGAMPRLRSMLSRGDGPSEWLEAVLEARKEANDLMLGLSPEEEESYSTVLSGLLEALQSAIPPTSGGSGSVALPQACPEALRKWIVDDRIQSLPNNDSRGHMPSDLARYLFAAAFATACGRSPKTRDFPPELAAKHSNWSSGSFDDRFRVQLSGSPATTVTSHLAKDGHYFIHPDATQVRSFTVREAARVQTFPDNYFFCGPRTSQYVQVGNAVPPFLARQIAESVWTILEHRDSREEQTPSTGTRRTGEPAPLAAAATAAR